MLTTAEVHTDGDTPSFINKKNTFLAWSVVYSTHYLLQSFKSLENGTICVQMCLYVSYLGRSIIVGRMNPLTESADEPNEVVTIGMLTCWVLSVQIFFFNLYASDYDQS